MTAIEQAQATPDPGPGDTPAKQPTPKIRKRRTIGVKELWSGGFIETPEEMESFLVKLRSALEAALEADERIQLK